MGDTIDLLSKQHREALDRLAEVEACLGPDGPRDFAGFLNFLRFDLAHHFSVEENALFPILEQHPHLAHGPVRVMSREHDEFRELARRLDGEVRAGNEAGQDESAADLIAFLRAHIAKEEHVLFPVARQVLSDEQQDQIDSLAAELSPAK